MNIIITGASRGIGYELVKHLAKNSDSKIFILARNLEKLKALKTECTILNYTAKIEILAVDLGNNDEILSTIEKIKNKVSHIDILINNAGAITNSPFEKTDLQKLEYIYKINVFAPFTIIQNIIPLLKKSLDAHVINISSMGGYQGSIKFPGLTAYSSSKAAIANLTECLAEEFKSTNIKFNCIALGAVNTEMLSEAFPGYKAPVNADIIAKYIADFAISGKSFFNGKIIPVSNSTP